MDLYYDPVRLKTEKQDTEPDDIDIYNQPYRTEGEPLNTLTFYILRINIFNPPPPVLRILIPWIPNILAFYFRIRTNIRIQGSKYQQKNLNC